MRWLRGVFIVTAALGAALLILAAVPSAVAADNCSEGQAADCWASAAGAAASAFGAAVASGVAFGGGIWHNPSNLGRDAARGARNLAGRGASTFWQAAGAARDVAGPGVAAADYVEDAVRSLPDAATSIAPWNLPDVLGGTETQGEPGGGGTPPSTPPWPSGPSGFGGIQPGGFPQGGGFGGMQPGGFPPAGSQSGSQTVVIVIDRGDTVVTVTVEPR